MARIRHFIIVCFCAILASCAASNHVQPIPVEEDQPDLACSYFYFLWGSHAEFSQQYPEALEAYEKALICDEKALYIKEKLPVLLLKMGKYKKAATWLQQAIVDHPENVSYHLFLAGLYIQENQSEKAIKIFNEILEKDPLNEGVQIRLGLLYTHQEQYQKAEKIFRNVLKQNNNSFFPRLYLARLLKKAKRFTEAEKEYEEVLTLNWSKDLAYEIGNYYTTQKQFADALRIYTTIIDNDHWDERANLSRVQILLDLDKNDTALIELNQIHAWSADPAKIDLIISKVLIRNNKFKEATAILEKLVEETGKSEPHYMLALLAYQDKNFDTALLHLDFITDSDEEFEEAVFLQTRILKAEGKTAQAITILERHIGEESSRSPLFYALLSSLYQETDDSLAAIALMEAAIFNYPENYQLFFELGLLLERNGMYQQAISTMEKVLELQPQHAEALNFIGYTWADKKINLNQALEYIKKADEIKPDNGYIIDSLGWVYYRLGEYKKAAKFLNRSLELEPSDPHIYSHLGDVYHALRKYSKALEAYRKAFEMFDDKKLKDAVKQKMDALDKR